jgi:putative ABC transport system permease protein
MRQDLRAISRAFSRSPVFAITAVLTLAIGIGASTAMFSIVNAVLLQPLPFHQPERLVQLWEANPSEGKNQVGVSVPNFSDWRGRSRSFDDLALMMVDPNAAVLGIGDVSVQARQVTVTPSLFALLGVRPLIGRGFVPTDGKPTSTDGEEVVLSYTFWNRAFGGDRGVIGTSVRVEGAPGTVIVGVMPAGFSFPDEVDVWMPLDLSRTTGFERDGRFARVVGRLKPQVSLASARSELESVAAGLAREYPVTNSGWTTEIATLHESSAGRHRLAMLTLFAATAFVMLVGCANASTLLLARGMTRRGELAVRTALGASRGRVARLLLTEAFVVAAAGGLAALLLAKLLIMAAIPLAVRFAPRIAAAELSLPVLLFCAVVSIAAAIVSGLLPAVRLSRTDLQTAMKPSGERSTRTRGHSRTQQAIVSMQLALCLVLVIGAMLFIRTFVRLSTIDLGFNPAHVISIDARFPMYRSMARNRWQLLATDTSAVLRRLQSTPGVEAASATNYAPLSGTIVPAQVTIHGSAGQQQAVYRNVTPAFFATLGIPFVAGRDFTDADISDLARLPDPNAHRRSEGVAIINATAARMFWPGANPLGRLLSTQYDPGISARRVVGVVQDVRSETLRDRMPAEVYVPSLEDPSFAMTLLIRTPLPPAQIVPALRHEIAQAAPDLSTANVRLLSDIVDESMGSAPFNTVIVTGFAAAALLLSAIGVFGVFAFGVAARRREIGIRIALGATRNAVTRLLLGEIATPVVLGIAVGAVTAIAAGRIFGALLYGVTSTDPASYALAIAVVLVVALGAAYVPVRRALRGDPATALRL